MRKVYQPAIDYSQGAVPIDNGGSSAKKQNLAVQYLGLLSQSLVGVPFGAVDLDASGMIKNASFPDVLLNEVINISGLPVLKVNQVSEYTITDFDSQRTYNLAAVAGVVSREGEVITYTAPDSMGTYGFNLNGKTYGIVIDYYDVVTPNIVSPTNEATNQPGAATLTSNAFAMEGGIDVHVSSDWEISTSGNFDVLLASTMDDAVNKTSWLVRNLTPNTVYFARVRYKANISGYSAWSPIVSFTTSATFAPNAPSVVSPAADAVDVSLALTVTGSAFDAYVTDTHQSSDWQIATDSGFTNIVRSATDDTLNKTSWAVTGLIDLTVYYVRVRYKGTTWGYSEWSAVSQFTTIQANSINTPEIVAPSANALGVSLSPNLSSSAFSVTGGSDSHLSSDWQIATDSGFTTIVKSTSNDTGNKTTWSVTGLLPNTVYYARVRHKGSVLPYSAWSTTVIFNTIAVSAPAINTPTNGSSNLLPNIVLTASVFGVTGAADTHLNTNWQIATDAGFSNVVASSYNDSVNKTSITFNLSLNTTYYARVQYRGTTYGLGNYSSVISFSTVANYTPNVPSINSPTANATNQGPLVDFTSSAFAMNGGSATHASSDWQIATDAGFTTIVSSATANAVNKTTWSSASLAANTTFYSRVRYLASNGVYSAWSTVVSFTTKAVYVPDTEEAIIPAPTAYGYVASGFGYALAMDATGTRLVIGAPDSRYSELNLNSTSGRVFVFVRSGSSWTLESQLTKQLIYIFDSYYQTNFNITTTSCQSERFGSSVVITSDGTRAVVCAPQYNHCNSRYGGTENWSSGIGRAIVYVRSGSTWTQESIIKIGSQYNTQDCPMTINGAGNRLFIIDPTGGNVCLRYYTRTGTTWIDAGLYSTLTTNINSISISDDGTRLIAGYPVSNKCIVYTVSTTTIAQEASITIFQAYAALGWQVKLNSDGSTGFTLARDQNSIMQLYALRRTGTSWTSSVIPITYADGYNSWFDTMSSLSADGNMLVLGNRLLDRQGKTDSGGVLVYTYNGTSWSKVSDFQASDIIANGQFGSSVCLANDKTRLTVTSFQQNKVYIYK